MLVVEGDPNLRYVALLAFAKITSSHADLVSQHSDVIMECIDDADISIRTRALDLVVDMINANNLQAVVERLLKQLRNAGRAPETADPVQDRGTHDGIVPMADEDEDEMRATVKPKEPKSAQTPPLPDDYRISVIERILEMCSRDTYANMSDFEWYIQVLVDLVKQCPAGSSTGSFGAHHTSTSTNKPSVADAVGAELLNVAVRVKAVRPEAAAAAQDLLLLDRRFEVFPSAGSGGQGVLAAAAFVACEYADMLPDPEAVLTSLLHSSSAQLPASALVSYVQAIPKVFTVLTSDQQAAWTSARRTNTTLLVARIVHFLEPLTLHPNLDVQERAVEYLDLMRLVSEAASNQQTNEERDSYAEPPLLLTQAIPSLFSSMELNPVAAAALRKVPQPDELDLEAPINGNLQMLLQQADYDSESEGATDEVYKLYHEKPPVVTNYQKPAADLLEPPGAHSRSSSYQGAETEPLSREAVERKKAERRERYKDDPYYIDFDRASGTSTPMHNILRSQNGEDLDVDAIPVMELKLDSRETSDRERPAAKRAPSAKKPMRHFEIAGDETLGGDDMPSLSSSPAKSTFSRGKKSLLELDSSGLSALSLSDGAARNGASQLDIERRQAEEEEMAKAIKEVERLRLEMQRAQERIQPRDMPEEGTVVKRKKKKPRAETLGVNAAASQGDEEGGAAVRKKKKKKRREGDAEQPNEKAAVHDEDEADAAPAKTKRKKKRQVTFDE